MKRIIIVEFQDDRVNNMKPVAVIFNDDKFGHRASIGVTEFISPTNEEILSNTMKILPGEKRLNRSLQGAYIMGANWFKSLLK